MNKWEIENKITSDFSGMLTQGQQEVLDYVEQLKQKINQLEKEVERLKEREKLVTEHYNVMVRHAGNLEGKIIQLETNWNNFKQFLEDNWKETQDIWFVKLINKMQELERGKE